MLHAKIRTYKDQSSSLRFWDELQGFHPSIYNIILLQSNIMSLWLLLKRISFTGQSVGGGVHVSIYKSNPGQNHQVGVFRPLLFP